ncbi:MAG: prepilin-type N-terminal cleavage/methylation domain-containing protein [Desulfobacteraceae bacterium]|nr:prepilin-type N-terminal cleavage/methylation domain-containing protein [Desulfobacteraceae bacterium]
MSNIKRISGFTLIEVVVVITIISGMLFFTIPMFNGAGIFRDTNKETGKLIQLIQSLKRKSLGADRDFFLNISMESHAVWVTDSTMDETAREEAGEDYLFDAWQIIGIEFPADVSPSPLGIRFSKKGYSDMVIIHLNDGEEAVSLKIEPFLPEVEVVNRYISFDDCI